MSNNKSLTFYPLNRIYRAINITGLHMEKCVKKHDQWKQAQQRNCVYILITTSWICTWREKERKIYKTNNCDFMGGKIINDVVSINIFQNLKNIKKQLVLLITLLFFDDNAAMS